MNGIRLVSLVAMVLIGACATQPPPKASLQSKLDQVYAGDHGEWLKYESAADRDLDVAHKALVQMEKDQYWNITQMQQLASNAATDAAVQAKKAEEVHKRIIDKRLHHLDSMHVSEKEALLSANNIALFRTGSASPSKVDNAAVREVVATLKKHPAGYAEVRGYTDTVGTSKSNDRLAAARANAVAGMLKKQGADRVYAHVVPLSMGEAGGPDNKADQANRRVDVRVYPHGKDPESPSPAHAW